MDDGLTSLSGDGISWNTGYGEFILHGGSASGAPYFITFIGTGISIINTNPSVS